LKGWLVAEINCNGWPAGTPPSGQPPKNGLSGKNENTYRYQSPKLPLSALPAGLPISRPKEARRGLDLC
jgi:hypothetical protein